MVKASDFEGSLESGIAVIPPTSTLVVEKVLFAGHELITMSDFETWLASDRAGKIVATLLQAVEEDLSQYDSAKWCLRGTNDGRIIRDRMFAAVRLPARIRERALLN